MDSILLILLLTGSVWARMTQDVSVGILIPDNDQYEGFVYREAIKMALENQQNDVIQVHAIIEVTNGCNPTTAGGKTSELIYKRKVEAIIGPSCTRSCNIAMIGAKFADKMLVSYGCTGIPSSMNYPNFMRTRPFVREHINEIVNAVSSMGKQFNWRIFGLVFSTENGWKEIKEQVLHQLLDGGFEVKTYAIQAYSDYQRLLDQIKEEARSKNLSLDISVTIGFQFGKV